MATRERQVIRPGGQGTATPFEISEHFADSPSDRIFQYMLDRTTVHVRAPSGIETWAGISGCSDKSAFNFGDVVRSTPPITIRLEMCAERIRINDRHMVTNRVYEVESSQGTMQFVKGADGVVTVYEIYDVDESWHGRELGAATS